VSVNTPRQTYMASFSSSYAWRAAYAWANPPPWHANDIKRIFLRDEEDECAGAETRHATNTAAESG
jgi:hypothetical protein